MILLFIALIDILLSSIQVFPFLLLLVVVVVLLPFLLTLLFVDFGILWNLIILLRIVLIFRCRFVILRSIIIYPVFSESRLGLIARGILVGVIIIIIVTTLEGIEKVAHVAGVFLV